LHTERQAESGAVRGRRAGDGRGADWLAVAMPYGACATDDGDENGDSTGLLVSIEAKAMTLILTIGLFILIMAMCGLSAAYAIRRGGDAIRAVFFGTGHPDPAPRGMQEEDPPPVWKLPRR
jgi:hypothetical protein